MIEPAEFLGLSPIFYALDSTLHLTLSELKQRHTPSIRALLVARYHGFSCADPELYNYCRERGIVIIEDRAHAFFGAPTCEADYLVYSAPKFFPVFEGGLLASATRGVEHIRTTTAPARFQLKAALWPHEYAATFGQQSSLNPFIDCALWLKDALKRTREMRPVAEREENVSMGPAAADGGAGLEPYWVDKSVSWASRRSILTADLAWIAARRRENWTRLVSRLRDVDGVRLIHERLAPDTVPYAAAFTVPCPNVTATQLRRVGVPLYRWDSFALPLGDESLRETISLSHQILQIPTHQALTDSAIDYIAYAVSTSVTAMTTEP